MGLNLFISWCSAWEPLDPRRGPGIVTNDADKIRRQDQARHTAARLWESFVWSHGGSIVNSNGSEGRAELPANNLGDLDKLRHQVAGVLDAEMAIGVGLEVDQADIALKSAKRRGNDCIILYTDELMEEGSPKELSKAIPQAQVAENSVAAGGGFTGMSQPGAPADATSPAGEASEHTQGETALAGLENMPDPEMTHAAADYEKQFHDHADAHDDRQHDKDAATAKGQSLDDIKQQVIKILKGVKGQSASLELLKVAEPQLFAAIQAMIKALLAMAHELVDGQEQPVKKSEEVDEDPIMKAQKFFREAAFKGKDGRVIGTGAFHDIESLPSDFQIDAEGFVGHDGNFYDRRDAAAMVGADHELHSEETELSKSGNDLSLELVCGSTAAPKGHPGHWLGPAHGQEIHPGHAAVKQLAREHGIHVDTNSHQDTDGTHYSDAYVRFKPHQIGKVATILRTVRHPGDVLDAGSMSDKEAKRVRAIAGQEGWRFGRMGKSEEIEPEASASPDKSPKPKKASYFKSKDGIKVPFSGTPERNEYDKKFHEALHEAFGKELKPIKVPTKMLAARNEVKNPHRYNLYRRMLAAGDTLSPLVVRRNGQMYDVIDGNHRLQAAKDMGLPAMHAVEITKSEGLEKGRDIPAKLHQGIGEGAPSRPSNEGGGMGASSLAQGEKLPMPENAPKFKNLKRPPGAVKDAGPTGNRNVGKVKVRHEDGKEGWVQVRAGMVMSNDGHPISSRNPSGK